MTDYTSAYTGVQIDAAISSLYGIVTNVKDFGATGNGVDDDTDAIQAAIDSMTVGGVVYFAAGTYNFTAIDLDKHFVSLLGAGYGATTLHQTTTGNGITIDHVGNHISNLNVTGTSSTSTGALIYILNAGSAKIDTVYIADKAIGIQIESSTSSWDTKIKNFTITGCVTGIQLGDISTASLFPMDVFIQDGEIANCTDTGLAIKSMSGLYMHDVDIISCTNYGINIYPTTGLKAQFFLFTNVLTDTCTGSGVGIQGAGTSQMISFMNCWSATNSNYGYYIAPAISTDIRIEGSTITNNGKHGIYLAAGSNVKILGNGITNNGTVTNNTYDGVNIAAAVSDFDVLNNTYGWKLGLSSNKPRYGVYLASGASDHYFIMGNRGAGNQSGTVSDNGSGTNKTVTPNLA